MELLYIAQPERAQTILLITAIATHLKQANTLFQVK